MGVHDFGFPWDRHTCAMAASKGKMELIQFARENGCPWDSDTCASAAKNGHLELLQWLRAQDCPWDASTCWKAAEHGHLEVLKWAFANGCPLNDSLICFSAAQNGHLEVLQWARQNGAPWSECTAQQAAVHGRLHVLQWATENGCPWKEYSHVSFWDKIVDFNMDVVQWLHSSGYSLGTFACEWAAVNRNLDALKGCHSIGLPGMRVYVPVLRNMSTFIYWNGLMPMAVRGMSTPVPRLPLSGILSY
jgi:hypothetical protein